LKRWSFIELIYWILVIGVATVILLAAVRYTAQAKTLPDPMPVEMRSGLETYRVEMRTEAEIERLRWVERFVEMNGPYWVSHPHTDSALSLPSLSPPPPRQLSPLPPNVERWRSLVEQYFPPNRVDWALAIIRCESGGDPNAYNASSGASGLVQHLSRYWSERSAAAGWDGASIFDPRANIAVGAWLLAKNGPGSWVCKAPLL